MCKRSKEVDWQPYFTTRLVDDFATHLRVFRKAQDRLSDREDKQSERTRSYSFELHYRETNDSSCEEIFDKVFDIVGWLKLLHRHVVWAGDISEELVDSFFEAEVEMERKICRDVVCTSHKDEEGKRFSNRSTLLVTLSMSLFDKTFRVCQVFFGTCASCFCICYYLLEISTIRTWDTF